MAIKPKKCAHIERTCAHIERTCAHISTHVILCWNYKFCLNFFIYNLYKTYNGHTFFKQPLIKDLSVFLSTSVSTLFMKILLFAIYNVLVHINFSKLIVQKCAHNYPFCAHNVCTKMMFVCTCIYKHLFAHKHIFAYNNCVHMCAQLT